MNTLPAKVACLPAGINFAKYISKRMRYFQLIFLFLITFFISCKLTRNLSPPQTEAARPKNTRHILEQYRAANSDFRWLSGKLNATVTYEEKTFSFNTTLAIRQDSLIWISVALPLGMEAARILVTNDTLMYLNRLNETYLVANIDSLNKHFQADINLNSMQSLFTATDLSYFLDYEEGDTLNGSDDIRFRSGVDGDYYFLGTISKRKLRKSSHRRKEMRMKHKIQKKDPEMGYIQWMWIAPGNFKTTKMIIDELKTARKLIIQYGDYRPCDSLLFPFTASYELVASKPVKIDLTFNRITLTKPQSVRFTIPEKYTPVY